MTRLRFPTPVNPKPICRITADGCLQDDIGVQGDFLNSPGGPIRVMGRYGLTHLNAPTGQSNSVANSWNQTCLIP